MMPKYKVLATEMGTRALMKVCRLCLASDRKVYDINTHNLCQVYNDVTGIPVSKRDKLPQSLCWECTQRLTSAQSLRNKAITSHRLLTGILDTDKYITIAHVKSINRYEANLHSSLITKSFDTNVFDILINDDIAKVDDDDDEKEFYDDKEFDDDKVDITIDIIPPSDDVYDDIDKTEPVEVKVEDNEIFFEDCGFVSEDDQTLSEVSKVKSKGRMKKQVKVNKKVKVKETEDKVMDDDDTPLATVDKFKTADFKRRRTNENIDENLFTITTPTFEQQIEQITKRKESVKYKKATFKCDMCYRGFHNKDRYDAHMVRHSEESGAFECFICKSRLKTSRALRKHITSLHTKQFNCTGCPFVTKNRSVARKHEKWHAGARYQCPHCPSQFDKVSTYLGHVRIKHASDFVCELCGYTFVSKKGIEVHKEKKHRLTDETASLEGPYCEVCDVRFVSKEAHSRHLKLSSRHNSDNDPNRIRNDLQSMTTMKKGVGLRRTDRRKVMRKRDDGDENNAKLITCEQCGVQLRGSRLYAQHFRRVHPDKNRTKYPDMKTPSMCEQCGKIFQSMAFLKDHLWVHTGENRFKCDRCDKSFTQRSNLLFHKRVHSDSRPTYACPLCGKHFSYYSNRRRHMFIHSGLKPFKCETCSKAFTTAREVRAHVDHVHLKKPWPKRLRRGHDETSTGVQSLED